MSITEQPNEILDMLLNTETIPLPQRIRLRAVSRRWLPVLEDGLARETKLVIREKTANQPGKFPLVKPDHLVIEEGKLTDEFIQTLARLFPGPTDLTLAFGRSDKPSASWNKVPSLLAHLATNLETGDSQLETIQLYGHIDATVVEPLARARNHLPAVTSLTLCDYHLSGRTLPQLGPLLSRLEAFACPDYCSPELASIISSSLSPACTRLMLIDNTFVSFRGAFLRQLSKSLTHLHLVDCYFPVWRTLSKLRQLQSLTLDFNHQMHHNGDYNNKRIPMYFDPSFFSHLSSFSHLTEVKIFGIRGLDRLALFAEEPTPLPGIERLSLELFNFCSYSVNYKAFLRALGLWFTTLNHLTLFVDRRTIPAIRASLGKLSFTVEIIECDSMDTWSPDW